MFSTSDTPLLLDHDIYTQYHAMRIRLLHICQIPVFLSLCVALQALTSSPALDEYLAQADCLRALFVALNDESKDVRATAVQLVGRLASWNPAYVAPALRRHLLQLLTDMDNSPDSKQRDDSAYLINCLINSAPQLIMPYVSPIQKVGRSMKVLICCREAWYICLSQFGM
jgi:phosphatidylinositol kinase/protein kinase (PI-3  family)